jgi:hypothetical protein
MFGIVLVRTIGVLCGLGALLLTGFSHGWPTNPARTTSPTTARSITPDPYRRHAAGMGGTDDG